MRRTISFASGLFGESGGYPWIVILVLAILEPMGVKVEVVLSDTMEAGMMLDTTLETMERSTGKVS